MPFWHIYNIGTTFVSYTAKVARKGGWNKKACLIFKV